MRCFVFSNYINAWSIRKGLSKLGLRLEVVSEKGLMPVSKDQPCAGDTLFFTEENNLLRFFGSEQFHFYPRNIDPNLIDDKLYFSKLMLAIGEKPVPFWEIVGGHTEKPPRLPIYVKARHSWKGNRKLPRGYICRSEEEWLMALDRIRASGWPVDHYFYQKWVSGLVGNNISVCGFFDHHNDRRNLLAVTRKLLGYKDEVTLGMAVMTIPDPRDLLERAHRILRHLKYTGPFELEFLYDEGDGLHYVLELNPRFWMQHGLFVSFFENGIIRRYLSRDEEREWNRVFRYDRPLIWVDSLAFLSSLLLFRSHLLRLILKKLTEGAQICFYPSLLVSLTYVVRVGFRRLKRYAFPYL